MPTLDNLLDAIKNQIETHVQQGNHTGFNTDGLLAKITDLFGQHKRVTGDSRNVRPASEDPYGDPASEFEGRATRPASQDPYGDPADGVGRRH